MKKVCLGFLSGCMLLLSAGSIHAQVVKEIYFSAAEGYVDGPLVGQPAGSGSKWIAGSADMGDDIYIVKNEAMVVQPIPNMQVWIYIPIPVQKMDSGTITFLWDWQYFGPPEKKMDLGFVPSDSGNYNNDGNPFLSFGEQCCPMRMGDVIDARKGDLACGGTWVSDHGVPYRDGVLVHMRMTIDLNELDFCVYAQREGEEEVQVAENFPMRCMPSNATKGLNTMTFWVNGGDVETSVVLDNFILIGPATTRDWDMY